VAQPRKTSKGEACPAWLDRSESEDGLAQVKTGCRKFSDSIVKQPFRRHCERSEAIHVAAEKSGLLRCARNDVDTPTPSRHASRPSCAGKSALENQRAQGKPGARCTRSRACSGSKHAR